MSQPGSLPGGAPKGPLSPEEFATRFQSEARILWTIAAGVLGDPTEAEDVLQDAALMALGKLDQYERDTNFTAWVASFVRNVALNQARKRRRRGTEPVAPDMVADLHEQNGHAVPHNGHAVAAPDLPVDSRGALVEDQSAFDDEVLSGLHTLAPDPRAALLLRTVMGMSYREIASVLAMPEGTAMSHVHRSRQALRRHLEENEPGETREGNRVSAAVNAERSRS